MAVKHIFLTLLSQRSMHGYDLKASFDMIMFGQWHLNFGQVYTTLTRLERDELVYCEDVPQGDRPDKKVYYITQKGREELKQWLGAKPEWNVFSDEMAFKFITLQLLDKEISRDMSSEMFKDLLSSYRLYLMQLIRQLTNLRDNLLENSDFQILTIERNILKAEADLKWIDLCNEKLEGLR